MSTLYLCPACRTQFQIQQPPGHHPLTCPHCHSPIQAEKPKDQQAIEIDDDYPNRFDRDVQQQGRRFLIGTGLFLCFDYLGVLVLVILDSSIGLLGPLSEVVPLLLALGLCIAGVFWLKRATQMKREPTLQLVTNCVCFGTIISGFAIAAYLSTFIPCGPPYG